MNPVSAIARLPQASDAAQPSPKLKKAAQDFEAILLSGWLEKMQESFVSPDQGEDPAHSTLASMGTEAVASALAARGGIGIARMIVGHFSGRAGEAEPAKGTPGDGDRTAPKVPHPTADEISGEHFSGEVTAT